MPTVACLERFDFPTAARVTGMCRRVFVIECQTLRGTSCLNFLPWCSVSNRNGTHLTQSSAFHPPYFSSYHFYSYLPHLTCLHNFIVLTFLNNLSFQLPLFLKKEILCNWVVSRVSLLLLIKRYNLYKVLACSMAFFQLSLFCAIFFQLCTFIFLISSKTSLSQRVLGLPTGLLYMGFHLLIFWTLLSSAMRSTWPNQFNLCFLINPIIFRKMSTAKQNTAITRT